MAEVKEAFGAVMERAKYQKKYWKKQSTGHFSRNQIQVGGLPSRLYNLSVCLPMERSELWCSYRIGSGSLKQGLSSHVISSMATHFPGQGTRDKWWAGSQRPVNLYRCPSDCKAPSAACSKDA